LLRTETIVAALWSLGAAALASSARGQPAPVRAVANAPDVTEVERYASRDAARIVLRVSEPVRFERGSAEGAAEAGPRLYVDLPGTSYGGPRSFEMKGLVQRVRLVPEAARLRLVLELSDAAQQNVFFLPQPFRLVIDVARTAPSTSIGAQRSVKRIALDPGHGGYETGATGPGGIQEKDIVLDIAHRAAPLLAHELGISTLLTRDTDERVALEERVAKANAFGADLFVSIHCNADGSRSGRGFISFILDGSHDRHATTLLERENAAPASSADFQRFLEQFDDRLAAERSSHFAKLLQRATSASLAPGYPDSIDGGVRGAGFYVLAGARMPAVLFETSFVSTELEGKRLATARYRQKLADAIVNAVRAYKLGY
jgi:N-acetylmuramoyl-L-alanine amidase